MDHFIFSKFQHLSTCIWYNAIQIRVFIIYINKQNWCLNCCLQVWPTISQHVSGKQSPNVAGRASNCSGSTTGSTNELPPAGYESDEPGTIWASSAKYGSKLSRSLWKPRSACSWWTVQPGLPWQCTTSWIWATASYDWKWSVPGLPKPRTVWETTNAWWQYLQHSQQTLPWQQKWLYVSRLVFYHMFKHRVLETFLATSSRISDNSVKMFSLM